jgi:hypothetical protein
MDCLDNGGPAAEQGSLFLILSHLYLNIFLYLFAKKN